MRTIKVGDAEVTLDHSVLEFGETNLNEFLQKVGGYHAYYAERLADAVFIMGLYESKFDETYGRRYRELKGTGNSVSIPLAKAAADSDEEVLAAKEKFLAAQLNKDLLNGFLKSIDKAFQAAMNYGYNKRKEMDKLDHNILESGTSPATGAGRFLPDDVDKRIEDILAGE